MVSQEDVVLRGGPRFVYGPAAGERGVIAFVPEARLRVSHAVFSRGQTRYEVLPVAVLELHETGITRHEVVDRTGAAVRLIALAGLLIAATCEIARLMAARRCERRKPAGCVDV